MKGRQNTIAWAVLLVAAIQVASAAKPRAAHQPGGDDVETQVAAFGRLQELDLSPAQLKQLKDLVAQVEPGKVVGEEKASDAYKAALTELRDALAGGDDEKIADAQEKVDTIREQEKLESGIEFEITDSARKQAAAAVSVLTASQLASYFSAHEDDVPDPLQTLMDALDDLPGKPADEYAAIRAEAAGQVALLLAGLDKTAQQPVAQKVGEWLDKAHAEDGSKAAANRPAHEEAARQIVGHPDPFQVLRHWMEREMASLMSNPALPGAIEKQIKNSAD